MLTIPPPPFFVNLYTKSDSKEKKPAKPHKIKERKALGLPFQIVNIF
ncbi:hypothetical protein HMPREF1548_01635 [Clostridium sp. KLE 1755]|nr:hypothetical protein HMPREF1548_01635 [Clostridium sp. KLE 1755]